MSKSKPLIFYLNGVEWFNCGVIQNGVGEYYWNGSGYYAPPLRDFKKKPSVGYKKYSDGSHQIQQYKHQFAVDLRGGAGTKVTCNYPIKITKRSIAHGSYVQGTIDAYPSHIFYLVHVYKWSLKSEIKAGETICEIAPKSQSGVAPHLHIWCSGNKIENLILASDTAQANQYPINSDVEIFGNYNFREVPNVKIKSGSQFIGIIKSGSKARVIAPLTYANGDMWYGITTSTANGLHGKLKRNDGWIVEEAIKGLWKDPTPVVKPKPPADGIEPTPDIGGQIDPSQPPVEEIKPALPKDIEIDAPKEVESEMEKSIGQDIKSFAPYAAVAAVLGASIVKILSHYTDLPPEVIGEVQALITFLVNAVMVLAVKLFNKI